MTHLNVSPAMLAALESALPEHHWLRADILWIRASRVPDIIVRESLARIAAFWAEHGLVTADGITTAQCDELQRAGAVHTFEAFLALQGIGVAREACAKAWNKRAVGK